ncbi:MAG: RNA-binding transcriptional accessory protein [Desulfobacteraceae bacterium]|uniref:RNA-binding transcriptional accessory protein n=1 Tax=Candidatus Desulfacyla euxinica TaxID=2841693 RepID=A0A8J6MZS0_9DELT|nr:RNA-binding transcriptional accessory protein [Candidatus Desulfacyla euxinica]MBL6978063.1 RNA-binding transcriptional accessory protein [Desulfobacteraceae bacterium]
MNEKHLNKIADELNLSLPQVKAAARLLEEGGTVPFIARYRKEITDSLDEVAITAIRDKMGQMEALDNRRESILKSLKERELLTDDLNGKIISAETMTTLEDIYLPFRPKRRTRATAAREKGLEPLAKLIFNQKDEVNPVKEAAVYIDTEKEVETAEDALAGSRDIIAEWVNEDQGARERMRALYAQKGVFRSRVIPGKEEEGAKFRDYFDWEEPVRKAPSHRVLAMRRGEKEGFIDLRIDPPEGEAPALLEAMFVKGESAASKEVKEAVHDGYKRLLSVSMETDARLETKKRADRDAIKVFTDNLRELLLAPPLGQKNVMAIDPGIRTGCKIVCLDPQGKLLHTDTIHLFKSEDAKLFSAKTVKDLVDTYKVEAIAIGNGTAGRETEAFINTLPFSDTIPVVMVNESGASIYSASEAAREEFPDLDLVYRGAVSIGRRLMDPLSELVKIDPKSIGVGQYQHDVNPRALKKSLDDVVINCVNAVGVDVNTASQQLLTYVSGLGSQLAKNIITYRDEHGALSSRAELKKVKRLGKTAFEQAAGFLRIRNGNNPLDVSAVHPESYGIVEAMARDLGVGVADLLENDALRKEIDLNRYVTDRVGIPTLTDILAELDKPGRDPRKQFENFKFKEGVDKIEDVEPGMNLPGVVTNVTAFGAFVDIGVHQDGLVHISQLANRFIKDPNEVVKVHQHVTVKVLDVDLARKRISLSMKQGTVQKSVMT